MGESQRQMRVIMETGDLVVEPEAELGQRGSWRSVLTQFTGEALAEADLRTEWPLANGDRLRRKTGQQCAVATAESGS